MFYIASQKHLSASSNFFLRLLDFSICLRVLSPWRSKFHLPPLLLRYALQLQEDWRIKMEKAILPSHDNMVCDGIVTVSIAGEGDTGVTSFRSLRDSDYFSGNLSR